MRRLRRSEATLDASRHLLEAELTRRYAQTDGLVSAARAAGMDSAVVAPLAGARSLAIGVRDQGLTLGEQAGSENALSVALHRVIVEALHDPKHKNDWTIQRPVLDLQITEERIAGAARVYNDHAARINVLVGKVPAGAVARILGVHRAPLFEATPVALDIADPDEPGDETVPAGEGAAVWTRSVVP